MKTISKPCVLKSYLDQSYVTLSAIRNSSSTLEKMSAVIADAVKHKRSVFLCGNGGSFAMAQHFAAEMSGRFELDRPGFRAYALGSNGATLTALANDFSYDSTFSLELSALSKSRDVLIAMSTSGTSSNIVSALATAKNLDVTCLGFTGARESNFAELCDLVFEAHSERTAFIQEAHLVALHAICAELDSVFAT